MSSSTNPLNENRPYSDTYEALQREAASLPVAKDMDRLIAAIKKYQVNIIVGETGSGKTTLLPKEMLLRGVVGRTKKIAVTQNRRMVAQAIAERIAQLLDVPLGKGGVGVRYKGVNLTDKDTRLDIMTDGAVVAAAKASNELSAYGALVIDEAHQHTNDTDILLAHVKTLLAGPRKDLKVVIMSATIDAGAFKAYFPDSNIESVSGRSYDVDLMYQLQLSDHPPSIVDAILHVHCFGASGNILVFVPGVGDCHRLIDAINNQVFGNEDLKIAPAFPPGTLGPFKCYPLSAQHSEQEQYEAREAVAPASVDGKHGRKIIIATNVAETSITLDSVTYVIDTCKAKSKIYNPSDESYSLIEQWISKAQAGQRAGRAGRTHPGTAIRLCAQQDYEDKMPPQPVADIMKSDMLSPCLDILLLGHDPRTFPYFAAPATETVTNALGMLCLLGCVDSKGAITAFGRKVSRLGVNVFSAVALLRSPDFECGDEMITLVSMMEAIDGKTLFRPHRNDTEKALKQDAYRRFSCHMGDHIALFHIYMGWKQARKEGQEKTFLDKNFLKGNILQEAEGTRKQLLVMLTNVPFTKEDDPSSWKLTWLEPDDPLYYVKIIQALAAGNFLKVAKRLPTRYTTSGADLPPMYETTRTSSAAALLGGTHIGNPTDANSWVVYSEYNVSPMANTLHLVSPIPVERLIQSNPQYWWDLEFFPKGHIQDDLAKAVARMTGTSEDYVRGDMPPLPAPTAA